MERHLTQDIIIIAALLGALIFALSRMFRRRKPRGEKVGQTVTQPAPAPNAAKGQPYLVVSASTVALTDEEMAELRREERRAAPPPRRPAIPENPETAAAASWGDVIGLTLPIDIEYLNQKGEMSQRRVVVFAAEGNQGVRAAEGWASRVRGRCLLVNEQRTFRVDGVQRLVDPTTGEVAETPGDIARLLARRIEEEIAVGRGAVRTG
jgi:hypothetical protein